MIFHRRRKRSFFRGELGTTLIVLSALLTGHLADATFRLCGFRLTMTLTALCKDQLCGGYFVPQRKRSNMSPLADFVKEIETLDDYADFQHSFALPHRIPYLQEQQQRQQQQRLGTAITQQQQQQQTNGRLPRSGRADRRRRTTADDVDDAMIFPQRRSAYDNRPRRSAPAAQAPAEFLSAIRSKRSGIATECCEKRCTLAYLRTYCCTGFQLTTSGGGSTAPMFTSRAAASAVAAHQSAASAVAAHQSAAAKHPFFGGDGHRRPSKMVLKSADETTAPQQEARPQTPLKHDADMQEAMDAAMAEAEAEAAEMQADDEMEDNEEEEGQEETDEPIRQ